MIVNIRTKNGGAYTILSAPPNIEKQIVSSIREKKKGSWLSVKGSTGEMVLVPLCDIDGIEINYER